MNRSSDVIEFLANNDNPDQWILAPNAPPVSRMVGVIDVAFGRVYDAQDINDTLAAFRTRALAASREPELQLSGSFSFGVRDVGRFRINYATQRGSRVLTVVRIPFTIPSMTDVAADDAEVRRALAVLTGDAPGLVAVGGPSSIANATLVYALLAELNRTLRSVLFMLERTTTFLLSHENSLSVQCELNTDVPTMEDGIRTAVLFEPDVLYVGDVQGDDLLPDVPRLVANGVNTIVSSVVVDESGLLERFAPAATGGALGALNCAAFHVRPAGPGKLHVTPSAARKEG